MTLTKEKKCKNLFFFFVEIFINYNLLFRLPRLSIIKTKLGAYKSELTPFSLSKNDKELPNSMYHFSVLYVE
jgi:hypothetical protein